MRYTESLTEAVYLRREKRYSVLARMKDGNEVWAHSPNPGRLLSCLDTPGIPIYLSRVPERSKNPTKYRFRVEQSEPSPGIRVGINPVLANHLAEQVIAGGLHPELLNARILGREVPYGENSRVDFLLEVDGRRLYLEVKSVTYREGDAGLFPDAVSDRACKHLKELEKRLLEGDRAAILFIVQRSDVNHVLPADQIDPAYGRAFRQAMKAGVTGLAMRVIPEDSGIYPDIPLEVRYSNF